VPKRVKFPGYEERAEQRYRLLSPEDNKSKFAEERGVKGYEVGRWLKTLPESFTVCERWAAALGVPTAWLFVDEAGLQAVVNWIEKGRPILPPPKPKGVPRLRALGGNAKGRPNPSRDKG